MSKTKSKDTIENPSASVVKASFDLDKITETLVEGAAEDHAEVKNPKKTERTMDSDTILKRYTEIPKAEWGNIQPGTYVRFVQQGQLKSGCKIAHVTKEGNTITFSVQKWIAATKRMSFWTKKSTDIEKIYKFVKPAEESVEGGRVVAPQPQPQSVSDASFVTVDVPSEPGNVDQALDQIGEKILFDATSERLRERVETLEREIHKIKADYDKMSTIIRLLTQKIK